MELSKWANQESFLCVFCSYAEEVVAPGVLAASSSAAWVPLCPVPLVLVGRRAGWRPVLGLGGLCVGVGVGGLLWDALAELMWVVGLAGSLRGEGLV